MFSVDLMEPNFGEFDLILGIDWLLEHRVSLDCASKKVILRTEENCKFIMIGERRDYFVNVVSTLVHEKVVRKGYGAYLALISGSAPIKVSVNDIQMVQDFFGCLS